MADGLSPINNNYHHMRKVLALIAEVKCQLGMGKWVSQLTGLKISHLIVFSPGCNRESIHYLPNFRQFSGSYGRESLPEFCGSSIYSSRSSLILGLF